MGVGRELRTGNLERDATEWKRGFGGGDRAWDDLIEAVRGDARVLRGEVDIPSSAAPMRMKIDWFLLGMVVAVGMAVLFPEPGAQGGWLQPEVLNKAGIALIFFLHGAALPFAALKAGTLRWPLHLVVQASTYLVFPLLGLLLLGMGGRWLPADLQLGFFYLCVLPSTVSSSVAMTAAARGNVPAAVFNATLSSMLGVMLTPLWVSWRLHSGGVSMPVGPVMLDLFCWLVLPLLLGQLARPWLAELVKKHRQFVGIADRGTILMLVYTSFCDSMRWGVWSGQGLGVVAATAVGALLLFWLLFAITNALGRACGFPIEDRITAVFCGSKKTLASGVPMARLIFGAHPGLAFILLPILIYHPLQLLICGVLAGRWARRSGSGGGGWGDAAEGAGRS